MNDNKQKKKIDPLDMVFGIACLLVVAVLITYWLNFKNNPISSEVGNWGAFGDYVGGTINPILGFFSFMALLITLDLQRKQLNKTKEQLELNREELVETRNTLERSAQAHEDSKVIMNEQLKTQSLQQFDSLFSTLLSELSRKIGSLYPVKVEALFSKLIINYESNRVKREKIIEDGEVTTLFIFLYQILKNIDNRLDDYLSKKKYSNIVRSLIPDEILQLLLINCFLNTEEHNFKEYKKLVEKFQFFEHMSLNDDTCLMKTSLLLSVATHYEIKAYGQNRAYINFSKNLIFDEIKKNNNLVEVLRNIANNSIEVKRERLIEGENHNLFYVRDGDDCPNIACVWSTQKKCFTHLNLLNQRVEKIKIDSEKIYLFSESYPKGIGISLEKDSSGKVRILKENIFEYVVPTLEK